MLNSVDVRNFLDSAGVRHELQLLSQSCPDAATAAAQVGADLEEIAQARLLLVGNQPLLVLLPGAMELVHERVAELAGEEGEAVVEADAQLVLELTGYLRGSTPPVALNTEMRVVVDARLCKRPVIYTGSGQFNALLRIGVPDLLRLTKAMVADIAAARDEGV